MVYIKNECISFSLCSPLIFIYFLFFFSLLSSCYKLEVELREGGGKLDWVFLRVFCLFFFLFVCF